MSASPDRLQFGVNLYPQQWRDAARIEELGYDSVWTSEHIFFYFPTSDALTTLAAATFGRGRGFGGLATFVPSARAVQPRW
ncbi:hypothetical protein LCGC14_1394410 [marine sediment metagenome]|uniref:Luciferase-like domain-containing protein n=1 Tax=marine sediment metagenome TaxID=412755 RepID=A0A0F9KJT4_9ZZZZ